jgi:hypothetical protein
MRGKRNDVEESTADREAAFTPVTSAAVLVLVILFGVTTPSTENRSIWVSIRTNFGTGLETSLGGGVASTPGEGGCSEDTEMIRTSEATAPEFNAPHATVWKAWIDPPDPQVSLWWWPKGLATTQLAYKPGGSERGVPAQVEMMASFAKEGKTRLTMQMVFLPAEAHDQDLRE